MVGKIRDITQKDGGDFIRFSILKYRDERFALIIDKHTWLDNRREQLRIETSPKRVAELANEILSYLDKKAKIKLWKPTMDDLVSKLREKWRDEIYMQMWFIDWVRFPEKNRKIQARKIYEWLHMNKDWLYRDD